MLDPVEECRMKKLEHEVRELRKELKNLRDQTDILMVHTDKFGPIKQKDEPFSPF